MRYRRILNLLTGVVIISSCEKLGTTIPGTSSLTVINTMVGANNLLINFGDQGASGNYADARQLLYNNFQLLNQFNSYSGTQKVAVYNYPDTLSNNTPVLFLTLDLPLGSINSLFLTGTLSQPDSLLIKDIPPVHQAFDSSLAIRFVNLSPGSMPVSVNLPGQANGSEVSSMVFKGITNFKNYPATANVAKYTFEFRDELSGEVLGSYTLDAINYDGSDIFNPANLRRFRNFTLAFLGLPGGVGEEAQSILLINNF